MKYLIASALLVGLVSCGEQTKEEKVEKVDTQAKVEAREMGDLKIAFYHTDSLSANYKHLREVEERIGKKEQTLRTQLKKMETDLLNYSKLQEESMRKGLLSDNDIMKAQSYIQNEQQRMMQKEQVESTKLQNEALNEMEVIQKRVSQFSEEYCKANGIDILLGKGLNSNVYYIDANMDVTDEFTAFVNQRQEELFGDKK